MENIINKRFGRLKIISIEKSIKSNTRVKCLCDCGNTRTCYYSNLKNKKTRSCGCLCRESRHSGTHGLSHHPIYRLWGVIKNRCYNKNASNYKYYRNIFMCNEWKDDFILFYNFCILNGWKDGLQIDRINSMGDYEPSNCRFTTSKVQNRNTKKSKYRVINGKRYESVRQAAKGMGVSYETIRNWCGIGSSQNKQDECFSYMKY